MLIIVPQELEDEIASISHSQDGRECFDNLAIAHRKGVHLVSGSPAVLRKIAENVSGDASGTFRKIAQKHHEQSSVIAAVTDYILLNNNTTTLVSRGIIAGRQVYHVSFKYFARYGSTDASRLVAEDSADRDVYIKVLNGYIYHCKTEWRGLRCSLQGYGGGGSSTADQFEDHAKLGPTIGVVDSDKLAPMGALGNTARAVLEKVGARETESICDVFVLQAHELDNMIPATLLEECIAPRDDAALRRRWLEVAVSGALSGSEAVRYLDLKAGIDGYLYHHAQPQHVSEYITQAADKLCAKAIAACSCSPPEACSCTYLEGLGGVAVQRAANKLTTQTSQKIAERFFSSTAELRELWSALAKRLMSWGVASTPSRT